MRLLHSRRPQAYWNRTLAVRGVRLHEAWRARLPATLAAAEEREKAVYDETDPLEIQRVLDSFRNFVELCERKEAETGEPCSIIASY
jgi:hypothetical protein